MQYVLGFIAGMGVAIAGIVLWKYPVRSVIDRMFDRFVYRLSVEPYGENLWASFSMVKRLGLQTLQETSMRAHKGKAIERPLGGTKRLPDFSGLMFNPAQLRTLPTPLSVPVQMQVTIGKTASRPLVVDFPILVAAMAYGEALSRSGKVALARGASMAGTASNAGEGPVHPAERAAAEKLIVQYNRGSWGKENGALEDADAIEIQFGQGAWAGVGHVMKDVDIDDDLRRRMGLSPGQDAVIESRQASVMNAEDLTKLVERLRLLAQGAPIGAKIAAGQSIERDLDVVLSAGVDFVCVEGAQAGTMSSPPLLADDFGLPSVLAVCRASRHLRSRDPEGRVSLIMSGGMYTPADILKTLALGADAVYIGTTALLAVAHLQILQALPWEPPGQLLWYGGKLRHKFDAEKGARYLARYLTSCREELEYGVRALGKTSITQVDAADLFALDAETAMNTGVSMAR
jgi:glutamate synthase domain-containing protein 2